MVYKKDKSKIFKIEILGFFSLVNMVIWISERSDLENNIGLPTFENFELQISPEFL